MQKDKHWKTVKMGSSDESFSECGLSIGCWGGKILGKIGNFVLGSGYDPKTSKNQRLAETLGKRMMQGDVVAWKSPCQEKRLVLHKIQDGRQTYSLQEKIVFYRDDNKKLRRFDTEKN